MRFIAFAGLLLGLCAVAGAASIRSNSSMFVPGEGEVSYSQFSMPAPLFDIDSVVEANARPAPHEPPVVLILMAGLGFIGLAGVLRTIPAGLRRLSAVRVERERHRTRRRRVKVEIRMMA